MIPQHATLQLSRSRFRHNLNLLRERLPAATIPCAIIKADAYGHGLQPVASLLGQSDIQWACVYSLQEALNLSGQFNILILSPFVAIAPIHCEPVPPHLRLTLTDASSARHLSQALDRTNSTAKIHIQIDTGLTRAGVAPADAAGLADLIASSPNLQLEGLFAHLSHGDVPGHPTILQQMESLHTIAEPLRRKNPSLLIHHQNSATSVHLAPEQAARFNMARLGIALYGLQPSTKHLIPNLQPIAQLAAPILAIHDRPPSTGVGYSHTFTTRRPSRLAILPVGYAEGYPRTLSNHPNAIAQLAGHTHQDLPIVGRVSMDQIILDITDAPHAKVGDTAIVISWDPTKPNSVDKLADAIGTIGYEITTGFGSRLQRAVVD